MSKRLITEKEYQEDLSRGYTVLQWHPKRSKTVRDLRTGRIIEVPYAATEFYRCMECQFDSVSKELIEKHLAEGEHHWGYQDGNTPYGPMFQVEFENGIANSRPETGDQP